MQSMKTSCRSSIDHCQHVFLPAFEYDVSRCSLCACPSLRVKELLGLPRILDTLASTFYFILKMPEVVPCLITLPSEESWSCTVGPSLQ